MGCDYYTQVVLEVVYKDAEGNEKSIEVREEQQARYIWSESYDCDMEEPRFVNHLEVEIQSYGTKFLYEDGTWKCATHGRERVENLCTTHNIPLESLVVVKKYLDGWWR